MKIQVTTKPNSKKTEVEKIDDTHYKVFVKAPAQEGKANEAVILALKDYFGLPKSSFTILSGLSSRQKIIQIQ